MKKLWLITVFSLFLVSPVLTGCSTQESQESAREMVERENAEEAEEPADPDE